MRATSIILTIVKNVTVLSLFLSHFYSCLSLFLSLSLSFLFLCLFASVSLRLCLSYSFVGLFVSLCVSHILIRFSLHILPSFSSRFVHFYVFLLQCLSTNLAYLSFPFSLVFGFLISFKDQRSLMWR
jgi:hypothetical protein